MLEITCIALAIYFEARSEPWEGQVAVGSVIWNRARDSRWPDSPCEVVKQRNQFASIVHILEANVWDKKAWNKAQAAASYSYEPTTNAKFYATNSTHPTLVAKSLKALFKIGNHTFYIKQPL